MKKIEFKDVSRATDERSGLAQYCRILGRNLKNLRQFNAITPLIDEANLFEVSTAKHAPGAKRKLLRTVGSAFPFGALKAEEGLEEIIYILTTTDLARRRSLYPQFGTIEPLQSVTPPVVAGRELSGSDFTIKGDTVVATDQVLDEIETSSVYRVQNETQEKVYDLATGIAKNLQELAMIYARSGMVLNRDIFMRQLFVFTGDARDYRMDEKNIFVSILPFFK